LGGLGSIRVCKAGQVWLDLLSRVVSAAVRDQHTSTLVQIINASILTPPPSPSPPRRAKDLVQSNIDILHKVAAVLIEKENIDGDEFQQIVLSSQAENYLKDDAPGLSIPYQSI
jgi:hypothetical protein